MTKLSDLNLTDEDFQALLSLDRAEYVEMKMVDNQILVYVNDGILDLEIL